MSFECKGEENCVCMPCSKERMDTVLTRGCAQIASSYIELLGTPAVIQEAASVAEDIFLGSC